MKQLFLTVMILFVAVPAYGVAVDEKPLADPAQEAAARALMKEIRCLVCQNQSIEDSNADLAKDLRAIIRERILLGDSPDNVRAYLVDRYGDWVLLDPPFNKMTLFLWTSPFLFLGLVILMVATARKPVTAKPLSDSEKARIERMLQEKDSI